MFKLSMRYFDDADNADQFLSRKLKYFRFVYVLALGMMVVYFLRYNFEFHTSILNGTFFWTICLAFPAPLVYKWTKNLWLYASFILFPISIGLMVLLWTSGGIDAPGIFWITAIPLSAAILLGTPYAIGTVVAILGFLIASMIAKSMGINSNILGNLVDNAAERNVNVFSFFFYSLATSIYFIRSENLFQKQINSQKDEINNLFRILIHDIATPLTAIDYRLMSLIDNPAAISEGALKKVSQATKNVISLLTQVRTLGALKDGKVDFSLVCAPLAPMLDSVKDDLEIQLKEKKITLKVTYNHTVPSIFVDPQIFKQVIIRNILTNAIKFSHENGVIEVSTLQEDGYIRIEIRDYGIGIPAKLKDKLFNSHEHTNRKGTAGESGTGFGLPLTKEFTLKLQGQIDFESSDVDLLDFPRGTRFQLRFKSTDQSEVSPT